MAKEDFETDGLRNGELVYCPVKGWDCPYYGDGVWHVKDPIKDCDDFALHFESWDEWDRL